jgi:hypothetical protein
MPNYYVLGHVELVPAVAHFDPVMNALNRHGADLSGGYLDRGGAWAVISERVEAVSVAASVEQVARRVATAEQQRQRVDREIRFSVGPFVAEHIVEFLPDGTEGPTHSWPTEGAGIPGGAARG